jgi:hypothetical protein
MIPVIVAVPVTVITPSVISVVSVVWAIIVGWIPKRISHINTNAPVVWVVGVPIHIGVIGVVVIPGIIRRVKPSYAGGIVIIVGIVAVVVIGYVGIPILINI